MSAGDDRDKSTIRGPEHICGMYCDGQDSGWPCTMKNNAGVAPIIPEQRKSYFQGFEKVMPATPQHFNKLDNETVELLTILAEESAEIGQAVSKILRHGIRINPYNGILNRAALESEICDLLAVVQLLESKGILSMDRISAGIDAKRMRLAMPEILHHSTLLQPTPCLWCEDTKFIQKTHEIYNKPVCVDERKCKERHDNNQL